MDLRHLAVILDAGAKAAEDMEDAGLSHALNHMCEVVTVYALQPDGGIPLPLDDTFAVIAARFE
ncbi:hypothetical protein [Actinoplanes sp. NPDC051494]|uniref:hypothetical protein n=1 Tax=Actinoplanes sp. NPDC051494 TaxID=3363907 RepID=UPI0037B1C100